jgi:hypothetical protein
MGEILRFAMEMTRRGIRCDSKREFPTLIPGAWKPAHNPGSHISTATTAAGSLLAMKRNPAKIVGLFGFLHRTIKSLAFRKPSLMGSASYKRYDADVPSTLLVTLVNLLFLILTRICACEKPMASLLRKHVNSSRRTNDGSPVEQHSPRDAVPIDQPAMPRFEPPEEICIASLP